MKYLILGAAILSVTSQAFCGTTYVKSHTTKTGTFIPGHYRTTPNGTQYDNWSSIPNYNPYTGKPGWIQPKK